MLFFLMIVGAIDFAERAPPQLGNDLIPVGDAVMNHDFGVTFRVSEIAFAVDPPGPDIQNLIVGHFLFLEGAHLFLILLN